MFIVKKRKHGAHGICTDRGRMESPKITEVAGEVSGINHSELARGREDV